MSDPLTHYTNFNVFQGFQSQAQRDWLVKFGKRGVCIDSTHGTTAMGFLLTSLLVVDDCGKGLPCAFLISNSESAENLEVFFRAISDRIGGSLDPEIFMSDDAAAFWNAWVNVFGSGQTKKLLCAWHVDKNWQKNLREKVHDTAVAANIYHGLCLLIKETTEQKFRQMATAFLTDLSEKSESFYDYLRLHYFTPEERLHQWVGWRRIGKLI